MEEVKSMGKMWNSPAKFIEIILILISMYTGDKADEAKVVELLSTLLEMNLTNKAKSFSVLTTADADKIVPNGYAGSIHSNQSLLPADVLMEFFNVLNVLRHTISRQLEAGCRPIIAYFLAFAVDAARKIFNNERLAVHSEVQIPNIQIPQVGLVGGTLDFMTARVIGDASMDEVMYVQEGRYARPEQPTFIIVQAKRTSRLADTSSEAELFGQIKSQLIRSGTAAHVGALTDGKTWKFFHILEDRFYQTTIVADNDAHTSEILGILTLFAGG